MYIDHAVTQYRTSSFSYPSGRTGDVRINMDAPTIQPKFLPKHNELGLVAVGFSGGQVSAQMMT